MFESRRCPRMGASDIISNPLFSIAFSSLKWGENQMKQHDHQRLSISLISTPHRMQSGLISHSHVHLLFKCLDRSYGRADNDWHAFGGDPHPHMAYLYSSVSVALSLHSGRLPHSRPSYPKNHISWHMHTKSHVTPLNLWFLGLAREIFFAKATTTWGSELDANCWLILLLFLSFAFLHKIPSTVYGKPENQLSIWSIPEMGRINCDVTR